MEGLAYSLALPVWAIINLAHYYYPNYYYHFGMVSEFSGPAVNHT